jgi:hypothetical protein
MKRLQRVLYATLLAYVRLQMLLHLCFVVVLVFERAFPIPADIGK